MNRHCLAAAIVVALAPVALPAAPVPTGAKPVAEVHPYKNAKVGDFATYKMTIRIKDQYLHGSIAQTVTAKTDKEVILSSAMSVSGNDSPINEYKIDFTKPFDPAAQLGSSEAGTKFEKVKTGTETIEFAGKDYEAVWTSYRVTTKNNNLEYEREMKFWTAKTLPGNFVKMEITNLDGSNMAVTLELAETSRKK